MFRLGLSITLNSFFNSCMHLWKADFINLFLEIILIRSTKKRMLCIIFSEFNIKYGNNYPSLHYYDITFYRVHSTEATHIIQFLNSGLELVAGVELYEDLE